jgi:hypothetical protein
MDIAVSCSGVLPMEIIARLSKRATRKANPTINAALPTKLPRTVYRRRSVEPCRTPVSTADGLRPSGNSPPLPFAVPTSSGHAIIDFAAVRFKYTLCIPILTGPISAKTARLSQKPFSVTFWDAPDRQWMVLTLL